MNSLAFFVDLPRFDDAQCAKFIDRNLFFPEGKNQQAERLPRLKAICASCIHSKECLEYALAKQIPFGIWGGSTPLERDDMLEDLGKRKGYVGIALTITQLHTQGLSANEIASQLKTSRGYVTRTIKSFVATEQGADSLHRQTKDSSEGLR